MSAEHVHLIGIGGTGMTALAGLLRDDGCRVTGSDRPLYPPTSLILDRLGLEPEVDFEPRRLRPRPDLVVVGNAISRGNPELEETLDRGIPYTSMPRLIAERFLGGRHSIVVAGTHGKTTTASMLAWILVRARREPGFLIGGAPANFDLPFSRGGGEPFVIEGDEYDTAYFDKGPKFMHYRPDSLVLGTVEFDHADIYRDVDEIKTAFRRLVNLVPRRGLVVRHEESPAAVEVSDAAFSRVEGFGSEAGAWRIGSQQPFEGGQRFRLDRDGRSFCEIRLSLGGAHNARNAAAAAAAAHEQVLAPDEIADGLATFRGVSRRLELKGEVDGVKVIDDFAHHPTAIAETLTAVRRLWPEDRVVAVVEPRSWSLRRNVFQDRLAGSFAAADEVVIAGVYGAEAVAPESRLDPEALVSDLLRRGTDAVHVPEADSIVDRLARSARPGTTVVVMSNGAFDGIHGKLLHALRTRLGPEG